MWNEADCNIDVPQVSGWHWVLARVGPILDTVTSEPWRRRATRCS